MSTSSRSQKKGTKSTGSAGSTTAFSEKLTLLGGGPLPQLASPDEAVLETFVSLGSYRNQAVFAEAITNRILDDIVAAIAPRRAVVIGDFAPRGGIAIRVEATHDGRGKNKGR